MSLESDQLRQEIVEEARSWLLTKYHHRACIKGVGVDCLGLLIGVYKAVGAVPANFDPGDYSMEWFLHRSEEVFLAGVERFSHRVEVGLVGDVALYTFGRCVSHGAILVADGLMIHAHRPSGNVELCEMRAFEDKFHSYWSVIP